MKFTSAWILGVSLLAFAAPSVRAQSSSAEQPAKLADLLIEAEKNNPQIQAASHGWQSAKQVPRQVSTLPDPQVVLQQVNVGSPRPFAGYTNSDFSYIGLGFSQDNESRVLEVARARQDERDLESVAADVEHEDSLVGKA